MPALDNPKVRTRTLEAPVTGVLLYDSASTAFGSTNAATGVKQSFALGRAFGSFSLQGLRSTGGSTSATVQLQGRIAPSGAAASTAGWHNLGATFVTNAASVMANSTSAVRVTEVRVNVTAFSTLASAAADRPARLRIWLGVA
jgi:hypothetical protein